MAKLQIAAGVAAVLTMYDGSAVAQVPQEYLGVWVSTQNNQNNSLNCKRPDWALRENDGLINITRRKVEHWESGCDVSSFRILKSQKESAEVVLACGGEGMTWRTREIWSLQPIEARKALIVVQLQSSEQRDEGKRPTTRMQNEIVSSLYLECR